MQFEEVDQEASYIASLIKNGLMKALNKGIYAFYLKVWPGSTLKNNLRVRHVWCQMPY